MDAQSPPADQSLPPDPARDNGARHLMSVLVEDYFQVGAFRKHIEPQHWDRFESRLFRNTQAALDLLARYDVRATFFILGWNAERWPELVSMIVDEGHEIASGGYHHENIRTTDRSQFCELMQQAREAIESAASVPVLGYRLAEGWLNPDDLWLLDHLAGEGYAYDSSLLPRGRAFRSQPERRFAHTQTSPQGRLWELPPSSLRLPFVDLPVAGGNYFRQIPHTLLKHLIARWDRLQGDPLMLYFHVWELDAQQPEVSAADRLTHLRHYRNLGKMNWVLADYLTKHRFGSVAEYLQQQDPTLWQQRLVARLAHVQCRVRSHESQIVCQENDTDHTSVHHSSSAQPVSIVVPCYNEQQTIPYLARTLDNLQVHLAPDYRPQFLLVDDGSTDRTWELLNDRWADAEYVLLLRHEQNQGVARAIMTGITAAQTEIVCSMDCDCSYDPLTLKQMLPLLTDGIGMVTASPYHAEGEVKNVPGWRLLLSRGASALYRIVLGESLATYTSCFRIYRRSSVAGLPIANGNFLGIAEMLGVLLLAGGRVVEFPTTLRVRLFGHSKMKTLQTVGGHLRLLCKLLWKRMTTYRQTASTITANPPASRLTVSKKSLAQRPTG